MDMASGRIPKKPNSLEEQVDPRVQVELERLNTATDDINRLELDLDEAKASFRNLLAESSYHLECISKKLSPSLIDKAKPYYEARIAAKQALADLHKVAVRFERANSAHAASKEMVFLAEEGLTMEGRTFDHAWQEMLNHATIRVNESEAERTLSEAQHKKASIAYQAAEMKVHHLQKELKRTIAKTSFIHPYFEAKAHFNKLLEAQKDRVKDLEERVSGVKASYAEALRNLERISDEIHKCRKGAEQMHLRSPIETASSTTQDSSESTGSADSYPAEEYLRLPDRIGPGSTPVSPQDESFQLGAYWKLNEEMSPFEPYKPELSSEDLVNHHPSKPGTTFISTGFPGEEEWCEIPLASTNGKTTIDGDQSKGRRLDGNDQRPAVTCSPGRPVHPPRPAMATSRRQSIDALLSGSTDKVKEILTHGILKLNIGSLSERRGSLEGSILRPSSRTSNRELSTSDCENFTGVEMLTDDQISSLMLDRDIEEACHDILSFSSFKQC